MLGRWLTPRAIKLWPAERTLVIGEEIETTLAAATRRQHRDKPLRPAWAIGSSGGIARLPIVAGIEQLTILVDNDANGVGRANAKTCAERWTASGRTVVLLTPRQSATNSTTSCRARAMKHTHNEFSDYVEEICEPDDPTGSNGAGKDNGHAKQDMDVGKDPWPVMSVAAYHKNSPARSWPSSRRTLRPIPSPCTCTI